MTKPEKAAPGIRRYEKQRIEGHGADGSAEPDADNPSLNERSLADLEPVARAKVIRRALGLTQEEFASRYLVPLETLRDWEQGRSEPDQAARAYLKVIAEEPETVMRALGTRTAA